MAEAVTFRYSRGVCAASSYAELCSLTHLPETEVTNVLHYTFLLDLVGQQSERGLNGYLVSSPSAVNGSIEITVSAVELPQWCYSVFSLPHCSHTSSVFKVTMTFFTVDTQRNNTETGCSYNGHSSNFSCLKELK